MINFLDVSTMCKFSWFGLKRHILISFIFFILFFSKMFGIRFGFSKACLSFFVFGKTEQSNSFTVTLSPKHLPVISLFWVWVVCFSEGSRLKLSVIKSFVSFLRFYVFTFYFCMLIIFLLDHNINKILIGQTSGWRKHYVQRTMCKVFLFILKRHILILSIFFIFVVFKKFGIRFGFCEACLSFLVFSKIEQSN